MKGMSVADARVKLMQVGICGQTDWELVRRKMLESIKTLKTEKPLPGKKNQLALKAWMRREETAKVNFLTKDVLSSQRTTGVSAKRAEVERFLTFLYWKTTKDMGRKVKNGSEEDEDEDEDED